MTGPIRGSGTSRLSRQLPASFFVAASYVGTKGTHLPSAMSPLNVLDPLNSTISAIGTDLTADYNTPTDPRLSPLTASAFRIRAGNHNSTRPMAAACSATIAQACFPTRSSAG